MTSPRGPRGFLARRITDRERGSLPIVLLAIFLGMSLSAALVPIIVRQALTTKSDSNRELALSAAQTGLQIELGRIRAAQANSIGDITLLPPCGDSGALTGALSTGPASYRVQVDYYDADPRGSLLDPAFKLLHQLLCRITAATPLGGIIGTTPYYASITAYGTTNPSRDFTDTSQTRTLTSTYVFRTNNQNFAGGQLSYGTSGTDKLCLDAGSGAPSVGTYLTMQVCDPKIPDRQKFSYRNNLSILLNSSISTLFPLGLCVQAAPRLLGAAPQAGDIMTLQICTTDATSTPLNPLYLQQWSFNDSSGFQNATSATALGNLFIAPSNGNVVGSQLTMSTSQVAWLPTSTVGAGMAGAGTNQMVNYSQFGRCMDLQTWGLDNPFIAWPCKQTPSGAAGWNQRVAYNSVAHTLSIDYYTTQGTFENPGQPYCAVVPASGATGAALRIKVTPCSNPRGLNITWYTHTDKSRYSYAKLYTISDTSDDVPATGRCMTPSTTDLYASNNSVGYIVIAPCDGSLLQKWNADPNVLQATPLKDTQEK